MKARIVGWTMMDLPLDIAFQPDPEHTDDWGPAGQDLAEFAGRACYQSFHKPNPGTASNKDYLGHILEVGHESVLEHGTVSVYLTGISRSLTHELVRHRHFSYSQESQRYVDEIERDQDAVIPPIFRDDAEAIERLEAGHSRSIDDYAFLLARAQAKGANRKQSREAARAALLNATETKIVVTGNYRAWRHFFYMRGSLAADAEIRELAVMLFEMLSTHHSCKNVFQDFMVLGEGTGAHIGQV